MALETHPLNMGYQQRLFVKDESTFGTYEALASANAVHLRNFSVTPDEQFAERMDARNSRGLREEIAGYKLYNWSLLQYLIPGSSAGAYESHGAHYLLKNVLGTFTDNASYNDYAPDSDPTNMVGMSMLRAFASGAVGTDGNTGNVYRSDLLLGAWANTLTIRGSGGNPIDVEYGGGCRELIQTGRSLSTETGTVTDIDVTSNEGENFQVGSRIMYDASDLDTNSDAGYAITDVSGDNITVPSVTISSGDEIMPWCPPVSLPTASPIAGVAGSLVLTPSGGSAITIPITAFDVTVDNGLSAIADRFGSQLAAGVVPGPRRVTGNMTLPLRRDMAILGGLRGTDCGIVITVGDTSGRYATITMGQCRLGSSPFEGPEGEPVQLQVPIIAKETSSGDDDIAVRIY